MFWWLFWTAFTCPKKMHWTPHTSPCKFWSHWDIWHLEFHCETGDLCGASEVTVCRIILKLCRAICELWGLSIDFLDAASQASYRVQFYEYGQFSLLIGSIDACHVPIKCPSTPDAEEYRNNKHWFSLNVWTVCTPNLSFQIVQIFKQLFFAPYLNPTMHEQQIYIHIFTFTYTHNMAHICTRVWLSACLECEKNQLQCLQNTCFNPRRCCKVIIATWDNIAAQVL